MFSDLGSFSLANRLELQTHLFLFDKDRIPIRMVAALRSLARCPADTPGPEMDICVENRTYFD